MVKLLYTSQPLSIQVHPTDEYARSIGLPNGKSEAWYILSATPDAKVAIGLTVLRTSQQLRAAIQDGTIADLVRWHGVKAGDVVYVPAGTIHAIGPGLVIAEIQQHSDATFRLFDFGRGRDLHIDRAVSVADAAPREAQHEPRWLTNARTLLVACPYFVLERIDLPPGSEWGLDAASETWAFVLDGAACIGSMPLSAGQAVFLQADQENISVGSDGLSMLVAYVATEPSNALLGARGPRAVAASAHAIEAHT